MILLDSVSLVFWGPLILVLCNYDIMAFWHFVILKFWCSDILNPELLHSDNLWFQEFGIPVLWLFNYSGTLVFYEILAFWHLDFLVFWVPNCYITHWYILLKSKVVNFLQKARSFVAKFVKLGQTIVTEEGQLLKN